MSELKKGLLKGLKEAISTRVEKLLVQNSTTIYNGEKAQGKTVYINEIIADVLNVMANLDTKQRATEVTNIQKISKFDNNMAFCDFVLGFSVSKKKLAKLALKDKIKATGKFIEQLYKRIARSFQKKKKFIILAGYVSKFEQDKTSEMIGGVVAKEVDDFIKSFNPKMKVSKSRHDDSSSESSDESSESEESSSEESSESDASETDESTSESEDESEESESESESEGGSESAESAESEESDESSESDEGEEKKPSRTTKGKGKKEEKDNSGKEQESASENESDILSEMAKATKKKGCKAKKSVKFSKAKSKSRRFKISGDGEESKDEPSKDDPSLDDVSRKLRGVTLEKKSGQEEHDEEEVKSEAPRSGAHENITAIDAL